MQNTERTSDGKFAIGNHFSKGRLPRQTEREYLRVVMEACSLEQWREIVAKAVSDAKEGHSEARKWLASYLIGNVKSEVVSLTQLAVETEVGGDPLEIAKSNLSVARLTSI